jgi:hypothetical protein
LRKAGQVFVVACEVPAILKKQESCPEQHENQLNNESSMIIASLKPIIHKSV